MQYLHVDLINNTMSQSDQTPTQEELKEVYEEERMIFAKEESRGFCRAMVEQNDGQYEITEWEMSERKASV